MNFTCDKLLKELKKKEKENQEREIVILNSMCLI